MDLLKILKQSVFKWLPLALALTVICFLIYVTGQQNLRLGANDPQAAMALDLANSLSAGSNSENVIQTSRVDISSTLSTYTVIYDANKIPLVYTGELNNKAPDIPAGVLDHTLEQPDVRVTWQPQPDIRQAIVARHFTGKTGKDGYVVVGRSLKEVEERIGQLGLFVLLGWLGGLLGTLALSIGSEMLLHPRVKQLSKVV